MNVRTPEPHLLDFDWRFTEGTVETLAASTRDHGAVLVLGAPSVALELEATGTSILLIDRQPLQSVSNHLSIDPGTDEPLNLSFDAAIVDSPWYPEVQRRWLAWAALHVRLGGKIVASVWQDQTRPDATLEKMQLLEWIRSWAKVDLQVSALQYRTPIFELEAARCCNAPLPSEDWRKGDLLIIRPLRRPVLPASTSSAEEWVRFIFNNYQLALRMRARKGRAKLLPVPGSCGWTWPSVSRRVAGQDTIDLWSSRNEVAQVEGSEELVTHLRLIAQSGRVVLSKDQPSTVNALVQWALPPGPFWRTYEWTHRA